MEQEKEPRIEDRVRSKGYVIDLLIVIVLSIITIITVLTLPDGNMLRMLLGVPFLLFLPGYALVSFLWPIKTDIGDLERLALSLGLSIAIIIVIGLGLSYTPWGIALVPIVSVLFVFVFVTSLLGLYRRTRAPMTERFSINLELFLPSGELSRSDKLLAVLIVVSLIVAGIALGYIVTSLKARERYTEFYILDRNGGTNDYPKNLTVGEIATVRIGVVNHEGQSTGYRVRIDLLNETAHRDNVGNLSFSLNDGEMHESDFDFNISLNGTYRLEFLLFKDTDVTPYLEPLHLNDVIARD